MYTGSTILVDAGNMNKPTIYDKYKYTKCGLGVTLIRLCPIDHNMNAPGNVLPEVKKRTPTIATGQITCMLH